MILNLTQHKATPEQLDDKLVDLPQYHFQKLKELLTFTVIPSQHQMQEQAELILDLVKSVEYLNLKSYSKVMLGGPPFFISTLEKVLNQNNIHTCYDVSLCLTYEQTLKIIKEWEQVQLKFDFLLSEITSSFGFNEDAKITKSILDLKLDHDNLVKSNFNDPDNWLDYYQYETNFGSNPLTVHINDYEKPQQKLVLNSLKALSIILAEKLITN